MNEARSIDEADLIRQGLVSYWDARYAMSVFQNTIQDAAQQILNESLARIGEAFATEKVPDGKNIWRDLPPDSRLDQVSIGAGFGWEYGIRLGIGWRAHGRNNKIQPIVCVTIRLSAQYKRDIIFGVLKKFSLVVPKSQVFVDSSRAWPHEVAVWAPLPQDAGVEEIRTGLGMVLDCTIEWGNAAGGLRRALYPGSQSESTVPEQ